MSLKQGIKGSLDMEYLFETENPNYSNVMNVFIQNIENIVLRITEFMVYLIILYLAQLLIFFSKKLSH